MTAHLDPQRFQTVTAQADRWRNRLIDVSPSNTMLVFNNTRTGSLAWSRFDSMVLFSSCTSRRSASADGDTTTRAVSATVIGFGGTSGSAGLAAPQAMAEFGFRRGGSLIGERVGRAIEIAQHFADRLASDSLAGRAADGEVRKGHSGKAFLPGGRGLSSVLAGGGEPGRGRGHVLGSPPGFYSVSGSSCCAWACSVATARTLRRTANQPATSNAARAGRL